MVWSADRIGGDVNWLPGVREAEQGRHGSGTFHAREGSRREALSSVDRRSSVSQVTCPTTEQLDHRLRDPAKQLHRKCRPWASKTSVGLLNLLMFACRSEPSRGKRRCCLQAAAHSCSRRRHGRRSVCGIPSASPSGLAPATAGCSRRSPRHGRWRAAASETLIATPATLSGAQRPGVAGDLDRLSASLPLQLFRGANRAGA